MIRRARNPRSCRLGESPAVLVAPTSLVLRAALVLIAIVAQTAFAHAYLDSSVPAADAATADPVEVVELHFSEGVEVVFSTFKVYRIDAEVDLTADNAAARLNALASVLISRYNGSQQDGDGKVEVVVGQPSGDKARLELRFEQPLAPGHYVVMWRLLSVDTHVVDGHLIFTVTD